MVALVAYAGLRETTALFATSEMATTEPAPCRARGTISEIVFKSLDKKPLFRG